MAPLAELDIIWALQAAVLTGLHVCQAWVKGWHFCINGAALEFCTSYNGFLKPCRCHIWL